MGPLEVVIPTQGGSPTGLEELKNLISDLLTVLYHLTITLPQLSVMFGQPSNHCNLVEEPGIAVALSDPLHLGLLPPKSLLLSQ